MTTTPISQTLAQNATLIDWADAKRALLFQDWLQRIALHHHLDAPSVCIASADASFRRYFRILTLNAASAPARTLIIMDAPPDKEDSSSFVRIAELFAKTGLRVPQILEWDEGNGFMLLDDLGAHTMMSALDTHNTAAALPLFQHAIDALIQLQTGSHQTAALPPYDEALLRRELQLFPDWYINKHRQYAMSEADTHALQQSFDAIVAENLRAACVYVHRDFMPRNLMLPTTAGQALGVLDFQDAVHGPITYDIASLMRDAFISWDEEFVLDVTVRYWQAARAQGLPVDEDFGDFFRAVEWMGLQRHLKVAGIFARLTLRDGKEKYLADAPRFIRYIRLTAGRYRELTPLLRLIDRIEETPSDTAFSFGRL